MVQKKSRQAKSPNTTDIYAGAHIRALRRGQNMSQRELADKLNITFQQVQKYEKGVNRVSIGTLYDICAALGVTPIKFLKNCYTKYKLTESNNVTIISDIISGVKKLNIEEQQKVLKYMKNLSKQKAKKLED